MEEQQEKIYNLEELRKTHPKAYARWTEDEDKDLKEEYARHTQNPEVDFENFLLGIGSQFGRRPNGIRARLAKFFADIPGWDYEAQKKRDAEREELKKQKNTEGLKSQINNKQKSVEEVPKLDLSNNPQAIAALEIMANTQQNLFLTGEAGTGKSTLLNYFRKTTQKNMVVLAPTGVAALNVEGQTIHSFCAFGPDITLQKVKKLSPWSPKKKLILNVETIVIDEISMVRADLLDCVDKFLRLNGPVSSLPFGGVQMVFIGDLYQLPPVDKDFGLGDGLIKEYQSPYFFDSRSFKKTEFEYIELKTIYRQKDQVFKTVLNAVRNNAISEEHLQLLNQRARREEQKFTFEKFAVYLTPHNAQASRVNQFFLNKINSPVLSYTGTARGKFEDRELPTDLNLQIKLGAQVMMLNNDAKKRWVNGTMGKILSVEKVDKNNLSNNEINFEEDEPVADSIIVELETGEVVPVLPHTWEMFQFTLDSVTRKVDSKTTGTYTQYPFKLAWAITIHKAQGKTFDKVYVDLSTGTFAHGQLYVALSRCRTLEGLFLKRPIIQQDIILDQRIVQFMEGLAVKVT